MYCPVCFQNTLKMRSTGVIKLSLNGKSRNTGLFTYNLAKDTQEDLLKRMRDKIIEYMDWYLGFQNRDPIKSFEAYTSDCQCSNSCKIDLINTRISVIGLVYTFKEIETMLKDEGKARGLDVQITKP